MDVRYDYTMGLTGVCSFLPQLTTEGNITTTENNAFKVKK